MLITIMMIVTPLASAEEAEEAESAAPVLAAPTPVLATTLSLSLPLPLLAAPNTCVME